LWFGWIYISQRTKYFTHRNITIAGKGLQNLVLYRATPAVTWGLGFLWSIRVIAAFSRLLWSTRGTENDLEFLSLKAVWSTFWMYVHVCWPLLIRKLYCKCVTSLQRTNYLSGVRVQLIQQALRMYMRDMGIYDCPINILKTLRFKSYQK
jgi:hypothetical protein